MKTKSHLWGYLFALLATALWSVNFIIARGLSDEMTPVSISFYRWSVAALAFSHFSYKAIREDYSILKKHILYISVSAVLGISMFNTFIYIAGHSTSAVNMSMIAITAPIYILIFSKLFLNEKISIRKIAGILVVFAGALLLISRGQPSIFMEFRPVRGDLWMILAAMIFAAYSILIKLKPAELRLVPFQQCLFTLGTLFLLPFFAVERLSSNPQAFSAEVVVSLLYAGIFASLAAFLAWSKGISIIGPVKTGMIYYSLPLFSSVLAFLILGEEIKLYHLICLMLVISGILIATFEKKKTETVSMA